MGSARVTERGGGAATGRLSEDAKRREPGEWPASSRQASQDDAPFRAWCVHAVCRGSAVGSAITMPEDGHRG